MSDTDPALGAAREARSRFGGGLLGHPDVHGVGVGLRRVAGDPTGEYAVVVHVRRKLPAADVPADRLLPADLRFDGPGSAGTVVRVDVREHPAPVPEAARVRPVPGGVSAGASGTVGGWVWDTVTGQVVALSNAHVFGTDAGTAVLQPSTEDGGREGADLVARLVRSGSLDAAIAAPVHPDVVSAVVVGGGPAVFGVADPVLGMRVQKTGRTSGTTFGTVGLIDFDSGYFGSHSDLWVDGDGVDFSVSGDSGSLYLDADAVAEGRPRAVGLHWGGSGDAGVGHPIRAVFDDLGLAVLSPVTSPG